MFSKIIPKHNTIKPIPLKPRPGLAVPIFRSYPGQGLCLILFIKQHVYLLSVLDLGLSNGCSNLSGTWQCIFSATLVILGQGLSLILFIKQHVFLLDLDLSNSCRLVWEVLVSSNFFQYCVLKHYSNVSPYTGMSLKT